jgi:hypothetical protein
MGAPHWRAGIGWGQCFAELGEKFSWLAHQFGASSRSNCVRRLPPPVTVRSWPKTERLLSAPLYGEPQKVAADSIKHAFKLPDWAKGNAVSEKTPLGGASRPSIQQNATGRSRRLIVPQCLIDWFEVSD